MSRVSEQHAPADYAAHWQPADMAQAQFCIDTANEGDAFWLWGFQHAMLLAPYLPPDGGVVLDYGCGVGRVLRYLPAAVRIGVDASAEMLALARAASPGPTYLRTDGRSIPWPSGTVDLVYSLLVLQHLDAADAAAIVGEARRTLRPGGVAWLLFSAFGRPWAPDATIQRTGLQWPGSRRGAICGAHDVLRYDAATVRLLGLAAGFCDLQVQPYEEHDPMPYLALIGRVPS